MPLVIGETLLRGQDDPVGMMGAANGWQQRGEYYKALVETSLPKGRLRKSFRTRRVASSRRGQAR